MIKRQRTFSHTGWSASFHTNEPWARTREDGMRYYEVGEDSYPSITSILGYFKKKHILEWRARVGDEEANKISARASRRGTEIHNMVEAYLRNDPMDQIVDQRSIVDIATFRDILPALNRIDNIFLQERALYSKSLKIAGRCDLGADFDGVPSIIDFKTSLREKRIEQIKDYFEQATAYALMYEDMTGKAIHQIVIIIANDESPEPQVFISEPGFHGAALVAKVEEFRRQQMG